MMLTAAVKLGLLASGVFFITGLLTGVWKYLAIMGSEKARAPYYVDIAHRSSLMYAFAALLVAVFAFFSRWSDSLNFWLVAGQVTFFGAAIASYVLHGVLRDTNNQLARPHRLGKRELPNGLVGFFMWSLIVAELGGFLLLFVGAWPVLVFW